MALRIDACTNHWHCIGSAVMPGMKKCKADAAADMDAGESKDSKQFFAGSIDIH